MARIVFTCPATDLNVQHWLDEDEKEPPPDEDMYEAISCPACTKLHFVNRKTGQLLGHEK